ncbi:hypothetical protein AAF712_014384 [Marasmius tenuissimus]|uniref:F-box-like domain protein n=1 Tax=Marasmius tenuissimus TaxID=585030 RepID=A0ABR2ZEN8_9AGAR
MAPSVETFELSIDGPVSAESLQQYMWAVLDSISGVKTLRVEGAQGHHDALEESLASLIPQLPQLESLSLPSISSASTFLRRLSDPFSSGNAQNLRALAFIRDPNARITLMDPLPSLNAFRELKELSIYVSYQTFTHFLRGSTDISPHLSQLTVTSPQEESPSLVKDLLEVVSEKFPTIQRIEVDSHPEHRVPAHPIFSNRSKGDAVHFAHLQPILACTGITHFNLTHTLPLALCEDDLVKIARAWPSLRSLSLCPYPHQDSTISDHLDWPHLHLTALLHLSRHCPGLEDVRLRLAPSVDTIGSPEKGNLEGKIIPFRRLAVLQTGIFDWLEEKRRGNHSSSALSESHLTE